MRLRIFMLALMLLLSTRAFASDADEATEEARRHVNDAKVAYTLGEFDRAIVSWKEAYRLKPLPAILFNLAQAYRMAGDYKESRFQYENYLRELPNAPNRLEVERRIEQLAPLIAAERDVNRVSAPKTETVRAQTPEEQSPVEPSPKNEPPGGMAAEDRAVELPEDAFSDVAPDSVKPLRLAPWVVAGLAAACAVGSAVTYAMARSDWSEATAVERPRGRVDAFIGAGDSKHGVALGLAGVAAAAGVGSAVLFVF